MHLPRSGSTHPGPQRAALSCNVIHPGSSSVSADNGPRTDAAGHTVLSSGSHLRLSSSTPCAHSLTWHLGQPLGAGLVSEGQGGPYVQGGGGGALGREVWLSDMKCVLSTGNGRQPSVPGPGTCQPLHPSPRSCPMSVCLPFCISQGCSLNRMASFLNPHFNNMCKDSISK